MIYKTYENYKEKYYEAQNEYNAILNEKEELFIMTQPKSADYSKERVNGGTKNNVFDEYLVQKELKNIDQRLEEAKSILYDRKRLFEQKEEELKHSSDINDRIYKYKYLDKLKIERIAILIPCGEATVYRALKRMK
jgi:hypothetical protein